MVFRGHWRLVWDGAGRSSLPVTPARFRPLQRSLAPTMTGEASLYRVRNTDDPAGPTVRH